MALWLGIASLAAIHPGHEDFHRTNANPENQVCPLCLFSHGQIESDVAFLGPSLSVPPSLEIGPRVFQEPFILSRLPQPDSRGPPVFNR